MKRLLCIALILALGGLTFGQATTTTRVSPKTAKVMGMGGSFRVFSTGYDTFFGNPAGLATKEGSLTMADVAAWAYFKPTQENIAKVQALMNGSASSSEMLSSIADWITNNGLGAGASLGLGWAGKGFGLGFNLTTDEVASGSALLSDKLQSRTQGTAVVGLAFPINLGPINIRLGADARAYYLLDAMPATGWPFASILTSVLSGGSGSSPMTAIRDLEVVGGYGFAIDGGATIGIGPLVVGAMVRDYGFEFHMDSSKTVGDLIDAKMVPLGGTDAYIIMPVILAGASLQFKFGNFLAPALYIEAEDPIALVTEGVDGLWTKVHAGAEVKLLNFISARAGINKGWISVGAGLDLLFLEVDAALFTEEMGINPGDFGRTGIAIQAALRF
ncbi:MAG: hypothetical protein NT061_02825 [Spirochaetes bacterium]|nr:hypothetical protein [Spirochaetota bacterium]